MHQYSSSLYRRVYEVDMNFSLFFLKLLKETHRMFFRVKSDKFLGGEW